jgi:hypothetical protein
MDNVRENDRAKANEVNAVLPETMRVSKAQRKMDVFGMNFIEYDWYIYSIRNPEPYTILNHSGSDPIECVRMSQN